MATRILLMLHAAGLEAHQDTGIQSGRPRDCRLPDLGVVVNLPPNVADYSNLPGVAFSLVVEIVSEKSPNGEYAEKAYWYAEQGVPEYWVADRTPDRADDDAMVHQFRRVLTDEAPAYQAVRSLLLTELEAEYGSR